MDIIEEVELEVTYQQSGIRVVQVDHPYIQALLDQGASIVYMGEWKLFTDHVYVELKTYEGFTAIKLIKTKEEHRGKGYGNQVMEALCSLADATGTTLKLITGEVKRNDNNKIPLEDLPRWYLKYGFLVSNQYNNEEVQMTRKPIL